MNYIIFLCLLITLSSCNNYTSETRNEETIPPEQPLPGTEEGLPTLDNNTVTTTCYMKVLKRDTMVIHLEEKGNEVSGKLTFDNYEKDGSSGRVRGIREGDIIKLVYYFSSEGMNSVMDVFFKKEGDDLISGIGDMQTKGDSAYFINPQNVKYPAEGNFKKLDCEIVPIKYR